MQQDNMERRPVQRKGLFQRILQSIVRFNNEAEELDWGKMKSQLKWMLPFGRDFRGRITFLTSLSIFFMLLGVAYAVAYKYVFDFLSENIFPQAPELLAFAQSTFRDALQRGFRGTILWAISLVFPQYAWIIWILVAYLLYKFLMFVWNLFMTFFTLRLQMDCSLGIKRKVFAAILESDWMAVSQFHSGDLVNRIAGDSETISGFVLGTIPSLIIQVLQFFAASAMLIYYDWKLMVVALVGIPMYLFVIRLKARRTRDYNKRIRELSSKNGSFLNESMANIMVIKSFALVPEFLKRYRKIHNEMYELTYEQTRYGIVTGKIIQLVTGIVGLGVAAFMWFRILNGELTLGVLAVYTVLVGQVAGPVNAIMGFIMSSVQTTASSERVQKLFELPRDRTQMPENVQRFEHIAKEQGGMGLMIDDLSFSYIAGRPVVEHVNIDVSVGETVALVGPSGEGKTTMVRLMLGLLEPSSGTAVLTTPKGDTLPLSVETRAFFSYVPQGNTMFSGSIRDNMLLGDPDATDEMIIDALKRACAWDFIERAPDQLDSKLGERGLGLSEGQAQRLAIARALLRGAPILLLDEATSALDIYTEKAVLDNIFSDGRIKTCVLTTHRPSVFQICDRIYRVQKHKVELIQTSRSEAASF